MPVREFICLFNLPPYDKRVAPALRRYQNDADPGQVVSLLQDVIRSGVPDRQDYEHWVDSIAPDAGYKPSVQTVKELADMLILKFCIPRLQRIDLFQPWLSDRSDWFADLMDGGEELAGGRLEFTYGSGSLIATRQQIGQFLGEVKGAGAPDGALAADYKNLLELLETANGSPEYTLLKTALMG